MNPPQHRAPAAPASPVAPALPAATPRGGLLIAVLVFASLALSGAVVAACSSSSPEPALAPDGGSGPIEGATGPDGDTDAAVPTTVEAACEEYAAAWCEKSDACLRPRLKKRYADVATCKLGQREECLWRTNASGSGMSVAARHACALATAAMTCDDVVDAQVPKACAVTGSVATKTSCIDDAQCQTGACVVPAGAFCGTCQARVGEGEKCSQARCAEGLQCHRDENKCRVAAGPDEACGATKPCVFRLSCTGGTCVARGELNTSCDEKGETAPFCAFAKEFECGPPGGSNQTCKPFHYVNVNEPCFADDETLFCTAGAVCTNQSGGFKCAPPVGKGGDCIDSSQCLTPLVCHDNKCASPDIALCK